MNHRTFLASLSSRDRAALCETSDGPGLVNLTGHAGLILLFGWLIAECAPGWPILLIPQGLLLAFLFNLEHECTHKTPFRTAWLNEWAGAVTGFLIFQPFLWFRYFHLAHHKHTNDPARDPELHRAPKPETWADYALFVSTLNYWRSKAVVLWSNAFGAVVGEYVPASALDRLRREARVALALYALLLAFTVIVTPVLLRVWILPLALGFPFLRLYHLAEHGRCAYVADMFQNTRTVFTNRLVRFVTWNMPYHIEHHVLPSAPFHRLPDLHRRAQAQLGVTADGYARFTADYARGLGR